MDIIAAHRHGLIEQLDDEVVALVGRAADQAQRAVVLHHLYDHSNGQLGWALAEARQELRIASAIAGLRRRAARWGWATGNRDDICEALDQLARALGSAGAARTAAAYRAYRLSATDALRQDAGHLVPSALLAALDQCHHARRHGSQCAIDACQALDEEFEQLACAATDETAMDGAWRAIDATFLKRSARRQLGESALVRKRARDERRGWSAIELRLRNDPALPRSFRANPAQHFYAMQRLLRERRRQQWREACDQVPDAFELAA